MASGTELPSDDLSATRQPRLSGERTLTQAVPMLPEMEAKLASHPYGSEPVVSDYRVTLWEQPVVPGKPQDVIGWGEATFDLFDVEDAREAIAWAEQQLADGAGPYSKTGREVHDREYVVFANVPQQDLYVQIAGWNPVHSTQRLRRR